MPREELTQKVAATATALLGLTNIAADPVQSREHILISQLLLNAWKAGRDLDLPQLIREIEHPPISSVGAYSLETFFPAKDRLKFASMLNNVLASPTFSTWTMGEPLDLAAMLYRGGRPQQLIFYVAHLDDTQRMFFTTLLLEEMLAWTRRQPGTTNLRALLYFDEVFGYLPPHPANPPSKGPLLTLLKQARAFGVGVLLATQNPVDLDYKALSNAGTWFVGKLQTDRDKARLLEGMESAAAEHGTLTDRAKLDSMISALGNRIFLMHDIHRPAPLLFQSRWALSFLRGPMTREQVSRLMEPLKNQGDAPPTVVPLCVACGADLGPEVTDHCPKCGKYPWAVPQSPAGGQGVSSEPAAGRVRAPRGRRRASRRPPAAGPAGRRETVPFAHREGAAGRTRRSSTSRACWASPTSSTSWTSGRAWNTRRRCVCWPRRRRPAIRRTGRTPSRSRATLPEIDGAGAERPLGRRAGVAGHRPQAQGAGEGVRRPPVHDPKTLSMGEPHARPGESAGRNGSGLPRALSRRGPPGGRTGAGHGEGEIQAEVRGAGHEVAGREAGAKVGRFVAGLDLQGARGDGIGRPEAGREAAQADDGLRVQGRRKSRRSGSASARRRRRSR